MATTPNSIITPQAPNPGALGVVLSTAMTNTKRYDGTEAAGTALGLVFTAGVNGARIDKVVARVASTAGATASGTTTATVLRVWLNNGSVNTTAANNLLLAECTIAATAISAVAATAGYEIPLNIVVPAGYRIYAAIDTAIGGTNCALAVGCFGYDL